MVATAAVPTNMDCSIVFARWLPYVPHPKIVPRADASLPHQTSRSVQPFLQGSWSWPSDVSCTSPRLALAPCTKNVEEVGKDIQQLQVLNSSMYTGVFRGSIGRLRTDTRLCWFFFLPIICYTERLLTKCIWVCLHVTSLTWWFHALCLFLCRKLFLLWRKSTKIVASRAALFGSDINQIVWWLRLCPTPHWGSLQCSPRSPSCI